MKKKYLKLLQNGAVGKLQNKFLHLLFEAWITNLKKLTVMLHGAQDYDQRTGFHTVSLCFKTFWGFLTFYTQARF